jgi:proteic killer suppression protein
VRIKSIRHRGLKRFVEDDDDREIRPDLVRGARRILTAFIAAPDIDGVQGRPGWRVRDRAGTWSISASGDWRIILAVENGKICQLKLEDYH